ncbi:MAG: hypothetical protein LDL12_06900, partial [Anaerolinea sp.]|nr:hypothetical protein [Anaerolinea sp.]
LGRRYVAIDLDAQYVEIMRKKLIDVQKQGYVERHSLPRPRSIYSKRALQEDLRRIAQELGRLPTPQDVERLSAYDLQAFQEVFPNWGKALKAAKLEIRHDS